MVFKAPAVLWELEPIKNLQEVGKSSFPHNGESPIRWKEDRRSRLLSRQRSLNPLGGFHQFAAVDQQGVFSQFELRNQNNCISSCWQKKKVKPH